MKASGSTTAGAEAVKPSTTSVQHSRLKAVPSILPIAPHFWLLLTQMFTGVNPVL